MKNVVARLCKSRLPLLGLMAGTGLLGLSSCSPLYPNYMDPKYQQLSGPYCALPEDAITVRVDGKTYYRSQDIYYEYRQGAYFRTSNPYMHHPWEIPRYLSYKRTLIGGEIYYLKDGEYYTKQGSCYYRIPPPHYYARHTFSSTKH